jgi:hypothetical protein
MAQGDPMSNAIEGQGMTANGIGTWLLGAALAAVLASGALAQGSTGGSLGNSEKSLSGSRDAPRAVAPRRARPDREDAPRKSSSRKGGGGAGYDGAWTTIATGDCPAAGTFVAIISSGVITGQGFSGTVSPSGATRTVASSGGITVVATGQIYGRTGRGTYVQSDGCRGSFSSVKN